MKRPDFYRTAFFIMIVTKIFCAFISPTFKRMTTVAHEMHNIGVATFNTARFRNIKTQAGQK